MLQPDVGENINICIMDSNVVVCSQCLYIHDSFCKIFCVLNDGEESASNSRMEGCLTRTTKIYQREQHCRETRVMNISTLGFLIALFSSTSVNIESFVSLRYPASSRNHSTTMAFQSLCSSSHIFRLGRHDVIPLLILPGSQSFGTINICKVSNPTTAAHFMTSKDYSSSINDKSHLKSYTINGTGSKNKSSINTNTGHTIQTDIPKHMGGSNTAPQPVELLLSSLMGCTQATSMYVGRNMPNRIFIERLEFVNIIAIRDERGALQLPIVDTPQVPSRLQKVEGLVKVYLDPKRNPNGISEEELSLLKEQTEIRCPIANMMIASGCDLDIKWIFSG